MTTMISKKRGSIAIPAQVACFGILILAALAFLFVQSGHVGELERQRRKIYRSQGEAVPPLEIVVTHQDPSMPAKAPYREPRYGVLLADAEQYEIIDDGSFHRPIYVVLRSVYPILLGKDLSKTNPKRVFFVTGPCYAIVFYLLGSTVYTVDYSWYDIMEQLVLEPPYLPEQ